MPVISISGTSREHEILKHCELIYAQPLGQAALSLTDLIVKTWSPKLRDLCILFVTKII
jgi:hypothetical protein